LDGGVELVELMKPRQRMLLLSCGRGSPGNVAFKSGTNKGDHTIFNSELG